MLWEWVLKTNRTFESCSCPFPLERPVSRKAGKTKTKYSVLHVHKKWGFTDTFSTEDSFLDLFTSSGLKTIKIDQSSELKWCTGPEKAALR